MKTETFTPAESYATVLQRQEAAHAHLLQTGEETLLMGQHPNTITLGSSAKKADILAHEGFAIAETGRGGQVTLHSPGQLVAYPILDLTHRGKDVKAYVQSLQHSVLETLRHFGVRGHLDAENVGIWVNTPEGEAKIAAVGIRVRKWATLHGVALNVHNDLAHYKRIVPCGLEKPVTSLADLGVQASVEEVEAVWRAQLVKV